jgi:hypothetical protein
MAASERFVLLKGGLAVPIEPMQLLFNLQERGFSLVPDGDALIVQPCDQLTAEDCRSLRRWKLHILALLEYPVPEVA